MQLLLVLHVAAIHLQGLQTQIVHGHPRGDRPLHIAGQNAVDFPSQLLAPLDPTVHDLLHLVVLVPVGVREVVLFEEGLRPAGLFLEGNDVGIKPPHFEFKVTVILSTVDPLTVQHLLAVTHLVKADSFVVQGQVRKFIRFKPSLVWILQVLANGPLDLLPPDHPSQLGEALVLGSEPIRVILHKGSSRVDFVLVSMEVRSGTVEVHEMDVSD